MNRAKPKVTGSRILNTSSEQTLSLASGARLIVGVEFWERFSFFGMLSILTLFLTAPVQSGGFGWSRADALSLMGIYSGAMFGLQVVGGYLADRFWGYRRAVAMGTALMTFGHFAMAGPLLLPWLLGRSEGVDLVAALHSLNVPLGSLSMTPTVQAAISASSQASLVGTAYLMASWSFAVALGALMLGSTLMKSSLSVLLGDQFVKDDPLRDKAYAYYYLSISVAALTSGVVIGWVAERLGWHVGFTIAGFGMAIAFGLFVYSARRYLKDLSGRMERPTEADLTTSHEWLFSKQLLVVAVLAIFLCIYAIGWFQIYGAWTVFIDANTDRSVLGFDVPTPWIASFNALVVIVATPLIGRLWVQLNRKGSNPDILQKYAMALALGACGQAIFAISAYQDSAGPALPLLGIMLISTGEVVAWVSTYGVVYQSAPARYVGMVMGAFFAFTLGIGGFVAGRIGALVDDFGFGPVFFCLAIVMAVFAVLAIAVRPVLLDSKI
jgi:proton-dependent oligopeptide transporter, POT family